MSSIGKSLLALAAAGALTAGAASAQSLGERLDSGSLSPAAFDQLVAGTGLSEDEARALTVNDILYIWTDND